MKISGGKREILTFLLVGLINTIVGLTSIFFLLNIVSIGYWPATFFGNAFAMVLSYFLNKNYTFRDKRMVSCSIIKFFGVTIMCYIASYWIGIYLSDGLLMFLYYKEEVSVLIGSGFYTITNFLGQKFYVFNSEQKRSYTI